MYKRVTNNYVHRYMTNWFIEAQKYILKRGLECELQWNEINV